MKNYDLEDLTIFLACALDNMKLILDAMEDSYPTHTKDAMLSVYVHLCYLSSEIDARINTTVKAGEVVDH